MEENMEKKFLLGVINDRIVLGEFEVRNWNGYPEFSATFDEGEAFDTNLSESEMEDWWEEYWYCLDDSSKLDALRDGDRTKQEWLDEQVQDTYYSDIKDCSCTDLEMDFNSITINFETICCGQHDCRRDNDFDDMVFTNKGAFDKLMALWDKYHLREINDDVLKELDEIENSLSPYEWYGGNEVIGFIEKNLKY